MHEIKRLVTVLDASTLVQLKGGTTSASSSTDSIIDGDIDVF